MSIVRNIKLPEKIKSVEGEVLDYVVKEKDYLKEVTLPSSAIVGLCEVQGRRSAQEDVLICHTVEGFDKFNSAQRSALLKNTCEAMQEKHGQRNTGGSTLNATIAWASDSHFNIVNANIGDSASFLVLIDEEKNKVTSRRINTLHEYPIYKLNGDIMMHRAIGDQKFEPELSHHPDIVDLSFAISNRRMFLVTACDGLTEHDVLDTEKIASIVSDNRHKDVAEIAQILVTEALTRSVDLETSEDNISVSMTEVIPNQAPTLMAVFDGHGGTNEVSEGLGKDFFNELLHQFENLKKSLNKKFSRYKASILKALDSKVDDDYQTLTTAYKEKLLLPLAIKEKISPEELNYAELTWVPRPFLWALDKCCLPSRRRITWLTQRELYNRLDFYRQFQEISRQCERLNCLPEAKGIPRSSSLSAVIHPAGIPINEIEHSPSVSPMSLSSEASDQLIDEVKSAPSVDRLTTSLVMG